MNSKFYKKVFARHQSVEAIPPNEEVASWAKRLIRILYPEAAQKTYQNISQIENAFSKSQDELLDIMNRTKACFDCNNEKIVALFFDHLPQLNDSLQKDVKAIFEGDPAANDEFEVIRTYPGFYAISFYRMAHQLLHLNVPLLPRILTEYAHSKTGIDIHPGARIGSHFFIDHGTGIVIGETTEIGDHVKLYQGVNLGALSIEKDMKKVKRHPTVEDRVVIYSGATILGGATTIGHDSIIGGNVWLIKSVPPYSKVFHKPSIEVVQNYQI